ncbi:MAG: LLM class flavin-dependent oxidoreductase [Gammaproteobacteria bacterium]|nr:LLM class flavin-dependent oxidoreductase [Gammaproteobacteria bacterium]
MQVWHFSEMAYHPGWDTLGDSLRNVIPSAVYDPELGADLYHRYLDEWALCDELGLNIMINEHHTTATCTTAVCTIPMAILARETRRARLLCLGMPIANRRDAVRIAEEYAMLDVISRGRVEMGFVKGSPFEISPANSNPATLNERFWEAHDLILKALTTHDGPFNWEGRHFHYRQVNVWPRPYQSPHPPVWMTVASPESAALVGEKGYVLASLNSGYANTPRIYASYRQAAERAGHAVGRDRFAYLGMVGVGETEAQGRERVNQILDYSRTTPRVASQFWFPPGYTSPVATAQVLKHRPVRTIPLRDGTPVTMQTATVDQFIDAGIAFAGTPDTVFEQIRAFSEHVGGLGHLLMMGQGGHLSHEETVANLTLFSREVLPRLQAL